MGLTEKWIKSTRSGDAGACLEARLVDDAVEVRDTKNRDGGTLRFTADEWVAFIEGTRAGS